MKAKKGLGCGGVILIVLVCLWFFSWFDGPSEEPTPMETPQVQVDESETWIKLVEERYDQCLIDLEVPGDFVFVGSVQAKRVGQVSVGEGTLELTWDVGLADGGASFTVPSNQQTLDLLGRVGC